MHEVTSGSGGTGGAEQMKPADAGSMSGTGGAVSTTDLTPYKASIRVPNVAAGAEGTVCVQVRLDNAMPKTI